VHGMRGWIQGYNAQAVCNERHLIVAAEVMTASPDFGHLGPMHAAARSELAAAGVTDLPEVVVADAGYWHLEQINDITGQGIPVLIPPDSSRRKDTRPGWSGGAYDFMRSVLATDRGRALYKQRAQLIEPVFGDTKHNRGFTRFARRGRSAARTEWRLIAATHNLRKFHQHFTTAAD
jgi:Transposase DDE domain